VIQAPQLVQRLQSNPTRRLGGTTAVPGDKSMSHRALILAAMADGASVLEGLLESEDVLRMGAAVQTLGATLLRTDGGRWVVNGAPWRTPDRFLDCGNSGTAARLLMGAIAGRRVIATLTGDASLRSRPMSRVIEPLAAMGADLDQRNFLPITVRGGDLNGISYKSPVASAQVKSAILLAGLHTSEPVEVIEPIPTRDHTEIMLRLFGCDVEIIDRRGGRHVRLGRERALHRCDMIIPGDPSSAAFAIVAALITWDSQITLVGVLDSPLRNGLLSTLVKMGAAIHIENRRQIGGVRVVDLVARSSRLKPVRVPASRVPTMIDEYPLLAVAAAFAEGETIMEGLAELRTKESDRLAAIESGLRLCGVDVQVRGDTLRVTGRGRPEGGALIETHGDHRIAMAFLVLGLASSQPVAVDDAEMIATSFPGFAQYMGKLDADIHPC
jgi:3-phosphoshikimate 1-carboxyvinyltransferase